MEKPLWTDVHSPGIPELPQDDARAFFEKASESPLNLLVYGPKGVGKTAAVTALGDAAHEDPDNDVLRINAADFFSMSKKELGSDPRFSSFITSKRRRNMSKAALMNHVLKELAGYQPVSGMHKTLVIDNAEAMRGDFQQALRRVMETYHETTQFVIVTRSPSGIIAPIQSRCALVPMEAPDHEAVVEVLEAIVDREGVEYTDHGIEFIAGYSQQNLRKAILALQTVAEKSDSVTDQNAAAELSGIGVRGEIDEALDAAENGDVSDARSVVDDLLVDEGMDGDRVLGAFVEQAQNRYSASVASALAETAGEIDFEMASGASDRVHITNFLTEVARQTARQRLA